MYVLTSAKAVFNPLCQCCSKKAQQREDEVSKQASRKNVKCQLPHSMLCVKCSFIFGGSTYFSSRINRVKYPIDMARTNVAEPLCATANDINDESVSFTQWDLRYYPFFPLSHFLSFCWPPMPTIAFFDICKAPNQRITLG